MSTLEGESMFDEDVDGAPYLKATLKAWFSRQYLELYISHFASHPELEFEKRTQRARAKPGACAHMDRAPGLMGGLHGSPSSAPQRWKVIRDF